MTDAHDQPVTRHYVVHYPPHPPRESDPHYVDFEAYRRRTHAEAVCAFAATTGVTSECDTDSPLELHHSHIEFSLQNGVDLAVLERDYPGISDPTQVGAWVESAANLEWLCVSAGSPVLMADGSSRAIEAIQPGDYVIGGDGLPDLVTAVSSKRYSGPVFEVGPSALTPTHRIATDLGWIMAGQIAEQFGVFGPDVVRLRCVEDQVEWSVVRPISIDVMDALRACEWSADDFCCDDAVFQSTTRSKVAFPIGSGGPMAEVPFRRAIVQAGESAGIGAVAAPSRMPVLAGEERRSALLAGEGRPLGWLGALPLRANFDGFVHDLSVAHSHSFVTGGVVVHNCRWHHRGPGGKHTAAYADFEAEKYVRGLIGGSST